MSLAVTRADGIVEVMLNRPDKLNAMTDEMWSALEAVLSGLHSSDRAVVLRGAGGNFCAGSDVTDLADMGETGWERIDRSNRCVLACYELPIPTIAVFTGIAAGSGLNLGLACDFVLAERDARLIQIFIRRGLSLDSGASWLLPRLVGERRARRLALLGESIDAPTALEWGLISECLPGSALNDRVTQLARRLATLAPPAVAGSKALLAHSWDRSLGQALDAENANQLRVLDSPEARAALAAFTDKR